MRRIRWILLSTVMGLMLTALVVGAAAAGDGPVHHPAGVTLPHQRPGTDDGAVTGPGSDCIDGEQESGAKYRICKPDTWIPGVGRLVVYAHGYVASDRPVEIPEDQMSLPGSDQTVDEIVTGLGFGFAASSYYTNGLAVMPAISDLLDVVDIFSDTYGAPDRVYLVGVSEGGLITALSVEQYPDVYDGGLAMCGPYGDFQGQVNHFGDFRVVFDYFFPEVMPGEPLTIPASLMSDWKTGFFTSTVVPTITHPSNITRVNQLLTVTNVSPWRYDPPTSTESIEQLLWYNVFATNDGVAKLGGQPFDNQGRVYTGSDDDAALNAGVPEFSADPVARAEIKAHYQTSGVLRVPLVTLHTTGDAVVPYWHAPVYADKIEAVGRGLYHHHIRVERHGHCAFTQADILGAFGKLVEMVENPPALVFLPMVAKGP